MEQTLIGLAFVAVAFPGRADAQDPPPETPAPEVGDQAQPEATPAAEVGYKKGFFVQSADSLNKVVIQGRVQARFEHENPDSGDNEDAFSIARARLTLKGHAFSKDIKYKFQSDFGKGGVVLKDFLVDYRLIDGGMPIIVRAGQWKRPFSRQQINSSGRLELVDRAITDKAFGAGRDIGVAVHNNYEKSPEIEWAVGVFNGTGDKPLLEGDVMVDPMTGEGEIIGGNTSNVPDHVQPAVVARAGYNGNGIKGYSEVDFEGGPVRFAVGGSALAAFDTDDDDAKAMMGQVDYVVKAHGIATTGGVYFRRDTVAGSDADTAGFHVQAGYLLGGKYQPVVRYAMVNPDGGGNNAQEVTGGMSIYAFAHNFKWQTDAGALISEVAGADSATDLRVRTQLQLSW